MCYNKSTMDVKGKTLMNKLKPYLKPYLKETILAPLFKLFEAILELLVPLVMAVIIDKGIGNRECSRVDYRSIFCGKGSNWIYR